MTIALADDVDPVITAFGGDITDPGWLRGSKTFIADAADAGSGVLQLTRVRQRSEVGTRRPVLQDGWACHGTTQ